ncbi:MAG TPA: VOC family protein [Caulobacteraceae bacterium]|jgi:catechol 2,3-dioxygenase-like lactoylglutathione lyase family enzyme|nr:VOC family protein [Caulobacteraceae bacterium]
MIGYATIGSNDLEKAKRFYDAVLVPLGGKRSFASDRMQGFAGEGGAMLAVCTPYDGEKAVPGNGNMVALSAASPDMVGEVYKLALANGATDEGAPGERMPGFYGAYFRDPDGNKVCVFKMG